MISQQFGEKKNRFKTIVVKNFNQSPKSQQGYFAQLNRKDINRIRERWKIDNAHSLPYSRNDSTCVPFETGRKIAPAPATFALALAMDGRWEPNAEAER